MMTNRYTAQIQYPGESTTISFPIDSSPFSDRAPKSDSLKAVKLTADNAREVAAYILKRLGGTIEVKPHNLRFVREGQDFGESAPFDKWLVEDYDYHDNKLRFRVASVGERSKYDLR